MSAANYSCKTLPTLIITATVAFSSLQSKLLEPQRTSTFLTNGEKYKFSAPHKTYHGFCLRECRRSVLCTS